MNTPAWTSVHDLTRQLGLKSGPSDLDSILKEIRGEMAELHPDPEGGRFATHDQEERFLALSAAKVFIAGRRSALVVREPIAEELAAIIRENVPSRRDSIEQRASQILSIAQEKITRHYRLPKVGLAVWTAAIGYISLFPLAFNDHPAVRAWLDSGPPVRDAIAMGYAAWAMALMLTASAWLLTFVREARERASVVPGLAGDDLTKAAPTSILVLRDLADHRRAECRRSQLPIVR